ncbi:wall-associated receptor kinase-like 10 isoform X2 [Corylus avellana]|uniref:wall-associated receptor kinase-like 10 isoform X2 n=1 Tax=Corylus avellana TaxID=13451 RepID=UPI00286D0D09|nr:wall-associated receptor kinase-like 10 isoform X2 [Corylus avellana]
MVVRMVFQSILLLFSIYAFVQAAGFSISSCQPSCGDVNLKYPFGIGAGCYADAWFEVVCRNDSLASPSPKPFLRILNLEVLDISLDGTVRVNFPTVYNCTNGTSSTANIVELRNSPFIFSQSENKFIALGCNNFASMRSVDGSGSAIGGCMSICDTTKVVNASSCNIGINCCQASIPSDLDAFNTTMEVMNSKDLVINGCNSAFLVEEKWFKTDYRTLSLFVPVVLEWWIPYTSFISLPIANYNTSSTYNCRQVVVKQRNTTFTCSCKAGYGGNPYVPGACHGISSGLGLLVLLVGGWWSYKVVKKRRMIKQKNKFFKRNGGLLLRQQLSSHEANVENIKLFNSKELEKATDRFNVNRVLGQGGQGTVYKGMLIDGRIVAVKKSKVIDEGKLGEFINEVVILSQINHRNVVKLIGCCLETEVPLLVYEYVPNGTLFQYFNGQTEEFPLTWDMRLRIATEVAGALFYLHSAASTPIYHRDIKSTNILLDDKFRAKVADFGTSRSIAVDQTHLTTRVHGTFGYLDPEYFQSSQFTEKSDVYSFGVVLAELLTGEKAISSTKTQEPRSLATYFIQSVEENSLFDIIDSRVLKEGKKEEIIAVANLAKRCLNLNGKKRPTMREVTIELQAVQMLQKGANLQQNYEELEYVGAEVYELWDAAPTSIVSTASIDAQPLL